jgi:hypothetical protein
MLISKMQTCLSDKMPPKKLKLKNEKMGLNKIRKLFFNFNFLGEHFVTKTSLFVFKSAYDLFQEKKFYLSEGLLFKFFDTKTKKKIETPQNKEKGLL